MSQYSKIEESQDIAKLRNAVVPLVGHRVREARLSQTGSLRVDFDPGVSTRGCRLGIYSVAWRLDSRESIVAASQDSPDFLSSSIATLGGQRLVAAEVLSPSLDTTFRFTDVELRVFPAFSVVDNEDSIYWNLHLPSGYLLCAGPGSSWSVRRAVR
ncbi:hypothetical protein ACFXPX_20645 [Kitasatospora sp. NPDC059146]|uniref:hypothetical protein n=1 Tax=unclassified Kitasatospora TaxID=2633591 RepID=UPI003674C876